MKRVLNVLKTLALPSAAAKRFRSDDQFMDHPRAGHAQQSLKKERPRDELAAATMFGSPGDGKHLFAALYPAPPWSAPNDNVIRPEFPTCWSTVSAARQARSNSKHPRGEHLGCNCGAVAGSSATLRDSGSSLAENARTGSLPRHAWSTSEMAIRLVPASDDSVLRACLLTT